MGYKRPVPQTPEQMVSVANELQELGERLRLIASQIERHGFGTVGVTNHNQLTRAMEFIGNYTFAAHEALREARLQRGDFGAQNGTPAVSDSPKSATKKRAKQG